MLRSGSNPDARDEGLLRCEEAVLSCFPDICLNYVKSEAVKHDWDPQRLIIHILDEQDKGEPYPKRPRPLKRKRQQEQEKSDEEEMRKKLEKEDARLAEKGSGYVRTYARAAYVSHVTYLVSRPNFSPPRFIVNLALSSLVA